MITSLGSGILTRLRTDKRLGTCSSDIMMMSWCLMTTLTMISGWREVMTEMMFDDTWDCFCVLFTRERLPCFPSEGGGILSFSSHCLLPMEVQLPGQCHGGCEGGGAGEDGERVRSGWLRPGGVLYVCVWRCMHVCVCTWVCCNNNNYYVECGGS